MRWTCRPQSYYWKMADDDIVAFAFLCGTQPRGIEIFYRLGQPLISSVGDAGYQGRRTLLNAGSAYTASTGSYMSSSVARAAAGQFGL